VKTLNQAYRLLRSWRCFRGNPCLGRQLPQIRNTELFNLVSPIWDTKQIWNLHHDPVSRRRRWKGKSQIWDSKIWSRVPRDSDPRTLARVSTIYKRQTCPLVREGAPQKQDCNCQTGLNIWSWAPDGARYQDLLTDWPSVAMWLWLWSSEFRSEVLENTENVWTVIIECNCDTDVKWT
jgi:hypothetical protein